MNNESEHRKSASVVPKIIVGVIAVIALYLGSTWLVGRNAHAQVDTLLNRATDQLKGQLRIVGRKTTSGFFQSVEDVTFAFDNPAYAAIFANNAPQFTVHNVIMHGPLPGLRTFGIGRVESTLLMTDEQRKTVKDILGTDKPLEIAVTFGFFGATKVSLSSPAMEIHVPKEPTVIEWKGMQIDINYSSDFKKIRMQGEAPGLSIGGPSGKSYEIDKITFDADMQSAFENLYVGTESFKIDAFTLKDNATVSTQVKNIMYLIRMTADKEFYNLDAALDAATLIYGPATIKDMHYDFALNHMHGPTLVTLMKSFTEYSQAISDVAKKAATTATNNLDNAGTADLAKLNEVWMQKIKTSAIALLKQSPVLNVTRIGFANANGDIKLSGHAEFVGVNEQDFEIDTMIQHLQNKLSVSAEFAVAQNLIDHWPIGMTPEVAEKTFAQLVSQGYLQRKGDRLETHLEFKAGAFTANGKKVGGQ